MQHKTDHRSVKETGKDERDISTWLMKNRYQLLIQSPDGIHIIDLQGNLIYANRAFYQMLGYIPEEDTPIKVEDWDIQWAPDELIAIIADLQKNNHIFTTRHRRKDGSIYHAQVNISTIEYAEQKYLYCSARDISQQILLAAELEKSKEQHRFVVENVKEIVFHTDAQGLWLFLNPAWQEVTGFSVEESLGRPFLDYVHPEDRQRNIDLFQPLIERKKDYCRHQVRYLHKDGGFRWIEVWARLTLDEQGNTTGTAGTLTDITERKKIEDALRWNESLLSMMSSSAPLGFLVVDNRTDNILYFNQRFCEIWEIEHLAERMQRGEMKNNDIIPYCLPILVDVPAFAESCKPLQDESNRCVVEDEIRFTRGRTVRRYSTQVRGPRDEYYGRFYIFEDVTSHKQVEDALRESEAKYHNFVEQSTEGFLLTDENGIILEWNPAVEEITGIPREEAIGRPVWDLQSRMIPADQQTPETYEHNKNLVQNFLTTGNAPFLNKIIEPEFLRVTDGTPRFSRQWMFPIRTERGFRLGGTVRDVTDRKTAEIALQNANMELRRQMAELRELKDRLQEQAIHDPLTQLCNRRYLDEALPREVSRALRLDQQLGFILLDVDHFKQVNDKYGHKVGDEALQAMSNLLQAGFRASDIVCRYGGDEVLCVLPDATQETIFRRAEQIRQDIASLVIIPDLQDVKITVSIGVALLPTNGTEINTVLEAADKALYHAKETGRNRICTA